MMGDDDARVLNTRHLLYVYHWLLSCMAIVIGDLCV